LAANATAKKQEKGDHPEKKLNFSSDHHKETQKLTSGRDHSTRVDTTSSKRRKHAKKKKKKKKKKKNLLRKAIHPLPS
jgi:hypothetical protein